METYNCKYCNKAHEKQQSKAAHEKWCNPETRPDFSGEKNPMWGKAGKNRWSSWTNEDWDRIPFSQLGGPRRRERLLRECGYSCTMCGYDKRRPDGTIILQVDHIDGNNRNNVRENLRVLCPNCHAVHSQKFMHIGQKHTEETKKHLSKKLKGRRISSVS